MTIKKMMKKWYKAYLEYVLEIKGGEIQLLNVPIMREFPNVFSDKLSGVPLEKEVEVIIDVLFGMSLIAQSLYQMVPAELVELEIQLHELLDK
jgi:hypothetical protein